MSLDAILEAIAASGEAEVQAIEDAAQAEADELLAEARSQAAKRCKEFKERATRAAHRDRARIVHKARLESLRTLGDVRESLIDEALHQAHDQLATMRSDPAYPSLLRRLLEEALRALEESVEDISHCHLLADGRDRDCLETILHDMGLTLRVDYSLECWGGLVVSSANGRVVVNNTLESRLERANRFLRRSLAAFFADGVTEETQRLSTITETLA